MLKFFLGVLVAGILSTNVNADWERVGSSDEYYYYVDTDKTRKASEYGKTYLKVWGKQIVYNDITKDGLSVDDYSISLWHINCNELTIGMKSYNEYKKSGKLLNSDHNSYVTMKDVIPNSIGESILEKSCKAFETPSF